MKYAVSRITLDLQDTSSPITLSAKQGDSMREIICGFRDDNGPYKIDSGCAVVFTAEKPDGNRIFNECTVEGNFVRYRFTAQTVSVLGALKCEFKIYEDMSQPPKLTSPRFMINVEEPVFNDGDIPESSYEFNAISDLVRKTTIDYLEAHPSITDKSLTLEDTAADAAAVGTEIKKMLPKVGGTMTGAIAMGGNKISGLAEPEDESDAATKKYADAIRTLAQEGKTLAENALPKSGGAMTGTMTMGAEIAMGGNKVTGLGAPADEADAANKAYVDGKHLLFSITIPASGWSDWGNGFYGQSITIPGISENDTPHIAINDFGTGWYIAKEEYSKIGRAWSIQNTIHFQCYQEYPTIDISIIVEVNR